MHASLSLGHELRPAPPLIFAAPVDHPQKAEGIDVCAIATVTAAGGYDIGAVAGRG
jgi:hypothetical protein